MMEFIKSNFFNTTTQLTIDSNTALGSRLLDRRVVFQYISDGFNDDTTQTSITIAFDATTNVSRIGLIGLNVNAFDIFYDGTTANTFSITTTAATTASSFTSNSETAMYLQINTQACTSVTFDLKSTQTANQEKAVSHIYISETELDFERRPSAKDYKPKIMPKEIKHRLSNGGVRRNWLDEKYNIQIKYKFITESFRDSLKAVYDKHTTVGFVPFGTMTSWDEIMFEAVWTGPFDFFTYSDDAIGTGFSGNIRIEEGT